MRRVLPMLLALMLVLAGAAVAEKTQMGSVNVQNAFTLRCTLPEGYTLTTQANEAGYYAALIRTEDETKPVLGLTVAFDELLADVQRMNDLDEAALARIEQTFREEDKVEISYMETSHGTKVMVVKETYEDVDYVVFYSIYMGYEVEIVMSQARGSDGAGITDAQIRMAMDFLSDLDFEPEK